MKTVRLGLYLGAAAWMCLMVGSAQAAEPSKATTDELPAALQALNPDAGKILTSHAASQIRGEGGKAWGHSKGHSKGHGKGSKSVSVENYLGVQSFGGNIYISGKNIRIGSHNHHFRIK